MIAQGVLLCCTLAAELGAPRYYAIDFGPVAGMKTDPLKHWLVVTGYTAKGQPFRFAIGFNGGQQPKVIRDDLRQRLLKAGIEVQTDGADRLIVSGCRLVRVTTGIGGKTMVPPQCRPTLSGFPSLDAARKDR